MFDEYPLEVRHPVREPPMFTLALPGSLVGIELVAIELVPEDGVK